VTASQNVATLVGRVLLALIFVLSGFGKLMAPAATVAYIAHGGLPLPWAGYAVALLVELGGGLATVLGLLARPVGVVLALFCLATAAAFHSDFADANMRIHFLKNVAMCGGFLYVAAFGAGEYSVDTWLRRHSSPLASARPSVHSAPRPREPAA
jgi:putative oxidoreductase